MKLAPERVLARVRDVPGERATEPAILDALEEIRRALETAEFPLAHVEALNAFLEQQRVHNS